MAIISKQMQPVRQQRVAVLPGYVQIGQPIAFQAVGGSGGTGVQTRYALTDLAGKIVQVASEPVFTSTALSVGEYRIYAVTYSDDQTIQHLTADQTSLITDVTASCLAISTPLAVHVIDCAPVCVPVVAHKIR
ncbi:hypothetical protein [Arsenicibacter rosenii]|nr:hypothetical protein [Arsenicibacter rosenii]